MRLQLHVRDKSGHEFPVAFHREGYEEPALDQYRKDYTVAILYPYQHRFIDITIGIRQEDIYYI